MLTNTDSIADLLDHCQKIERDGKTYYWLPKMMQVDDLGAIELFDFEKPNTPVNIQLLQWQMQANEIQDKIIQMCNVMIPEWNLNLMLGTHNCPDSPVSLCVYDRSKDEPLKECIYCKKPFHRG